ncbi:MAG TPA: archaetidylserine decarboxylase [Myxococcaceae bacterium]|nr:archaetidylserine decarboxylase [Myxococcaceae bacterium]
MQDGTFLALMRLVPKSALSRAVGTLTRLPAPAGVHQAAMRAFARAYRVDMTEADADFGGYGRFSDFFSRGLRPGARPVDADPQLVVSPVDGVVSQAGILERGSCLQAKGIQFPVDRLLDDGELAARFALGGAYATLYLSPRDYHRVHAPVGGSVVASRYLAGELWPVNPATVRQRDALFCINERLVTVIDSPTFGRVAVVKVGATCVGRIRAAYDERLTHAGQAAGLRTYLPPRPVEKGAELGRFEMGSTVILLFEPGRVVWDDRLVPDAVVRMGQRIGGAP